MDIQKDLVEDYLKGNSDVIHQEEETIKKSINTYIRNTKEKATRVEILQGEFVHKDYRGAIYR